MAHVFIGKFNLGMVCATPGVMGISEDERISALTRHINGDWGEVSANDGELNDDAVIHGGTILSAFTSTEGIRFWIITEADRSVTTFLLPEEY